MMNPAYVDLAQYMNSEGFAQLGANLFGGEWGKTDEQILILNGTGGAPSDVKDSFENPAIQVLVRGKKRESDLDVYKKAYEAANFILQIPDRAVLNGCVYKGFEQTTNIAPLGKDENERFIYSMNFLTYRSGVA